jgi:hypothetical protein
MVLENGRFSKACHKSSFGGWRSSIQNVLTITHTVNIRDWNTTIGGAAYFYGDGKEDFVVAESIEAALELAKVKLLTSHFSL